MFEKQAREFAQKIRAAETILIFGHKNPDGDSLGAALAIRDIIRDNFEKDAVITYDGNSPIYYDFMPGRSDFIFAEKIRSDKFDLVIIVDLASAVQMGDIPKKFFDSAGDTIKIDHHKTGDVDVNLAIVDVSAAATCEIIAELATAANWKIGVAAAKNLATGIYTDTQKFSLTDDGHVLRIAADLSDMGASLRDIAEGWSVATKNDILAQANILVSAEFFYGGRLAVAVVPNKYYKKLDSGETEILWYLRRIRGVEFVAILKEAHENEIGLSFRSRRIPIRPIAEKLGGGGHDLAAGGRLNVPLLDAKKIVVEAFKGM
ncbi:MAG: bifunctional oligoribonuclease/PAP phosphatase NrnA [Alphaproteobacteria bacterium]|nr:bifunctional oligoribonuclease/PAP phosphatase NrnA [Alphaproteobacteria bacterium]MCL2890031.1 bifunctional oligoribonuclease/PAP phosphatase NrnA [Alphaproteobacteria bacterium]